MAETINTLIIGAGQSGLALSYYLTQQEKPHLLLEQASQLGEAWRNHRWDSFTLVTPNWTICLPGGEYRGSQPDGFLSRDEIVRYLEDYAASFNSPVRLGVSAAAVDPADEGFRVTTSQGEYLAKNIVIATGAFQQPRIPAFAASLPAELKQLHSGAYRSPGALQPGAVLVIGSAQSGCQIAEELHLSGRKVYLSLGGSSGRAPRCYRGRDVFRWLMEIHFLDQTFDKIPEPKNKFTGNPQISGKDGGHTLDVHQFARDGMTLLGHLTGVQNGTLIFAPDHRESLAKMDQVERQITGLIDDYISRASIAAPVEVLPHLTDGYDTEIITALDLRASGITTLIWATGYQYDYRWVHLPVFDMEGFPIHNGGVTAIPGLYFIGLPWQTRRSSNIFFGISEDAAHIASQIR